MVSVIIPVYNAASRIDRCIKSILNQSYRDIEVIIINDGSKDNSLEVCRKYEEIDKRVHVYDQKNTGVSMTRNRGIEFAKGEFIQFVDSDDYIEPDMVKTFVNAMQDVDIDMAVCGIYKKFDNIVTSIKPSYKGKIAVTEIKDKYADIFEDAVLMSPVNKMYRKSVITEGFNKELSRGEDFIFNMRFLLGADSIYFIDKCFYNYVESQGSLIKQYKDDTGYVAEKIYTEAVDFSKKIGVYNSSKEFLSKNYVETVFYGLSDMYAFSNKSGSMKKDAVKKWTSGSNMDEAFKYAVMDRSKQKIAVFLLKHKMYTVFHIMMTLIGVMRRAK